MSSERVDIRDEACVSLARQRVRELGEGLPRASVEGAALIASELATNQVRYAGGGSVTVTRFERDGVAGLEVDAADEGPGIPGLVEAFAGAGGQAPPFSTRPVLGGGASLGIGLAAVARQATELDVDVRAGEGTRVVARLFVAPVRRRATVGVAGAGLATEVVSGDAARFWRDGRTLTVMLADGLGHGVDARQAVERAFAVAAETPDAAPEQILGACATALRGTRGAVLAVVRVDDEGTWRGASLGNLQVAVSDGQAVQRFPGTPGFAGGAGTRTIRGFGGDFGPRHTLLLATDGVRDAFSALPAGPGPAWALAAGALARGRKAHDDAMVVIVRG